MENIISYLLDKILLALFIGIIASAIFYFFLLRLKPKVKISPHIAKGRSTLDNRVIYRIKILNYTKVPIIEIKAQLHIFKNYQTNTGEILKSHAIKLKRDNPLVISKYDKKDKDSKYAYRFLTYEDLDEIWSDDTEQYLKFRLICKHSVSGFTGFFEQEFRLKRKSIKIGDFSKGDIFEII
jgi:hypothetical protein